MSGDLEGDFPVLYNRRLELDLAFRRRQFSHRDLEEAGRSIDPTAVYVECPESSNGRDWYGGLVFRRDGIDVAFLFPRPFDASYEAPVEIRATKEVAPAALDALVHALSHGMSESVVSQH